MFDKLKWVYFKVVRLMSAKLTQHYFKHNDEMVIGFNSNKYKICDYRHSKTRYIRILKKNDEVE